MLGMSSISVIIPCRDDASFLATCLSALAVQTRPADEIIVVDNASSDDTAEVARAGGATVLREPQVGILRASSAGFDAATGDILARLDADSVPPPDWLERIERMLHQASAPAAVTGPGDFYGAGPVRRWFGRVVYLGVFFRGVGWLLGHPPVFGSNFAMHREAWAAARDKVHREVRRIHDDIDLSIQFDPRVTVVYDNGLRVGISARPFVSLGGFVRRGHWVSLTIATNWREESLLKRRRRRASGRQKATGRRLNA
jgi:glycosyltransferase involved in cell wall biosynthesis